MLRLECLIPAIKELHQDEVLFDLTFGGLPEERGQGVLLFRERSLAISLTMFDLRTGRRNPVYDKFCNFAESLTCASDEALYSGEGLFFSGGPKVFTSTLWMFVPGGSEPLQLFETFCSFLAKPVRAKVVTEFQPSFEPCLT